MNKTRVTAENERGAKYSGVVRGFTEGGKVLVACDRVDLGYGWEKVREIRVFEREQITNARNP